MPELSSLDKYASHASYVESVAPPSSLYFCRYSCFYTKLKETFSVSGLQTLWGALLFANSYLLWKKR